MSRNLFVYGDEVCSEEHFEKLVSGYLFPPASHVVIKVTHPFLLNAAIMAGLRNDLHLYLIPAFFSDEMAATLLEQFPINYWVSDSEVKVVSSIIIPGPSAVTLFTSGTSGPPKMVNYEGDKLQHSALKASSLKQKTWAMTYGWTTYAGLQVFFSAFHNEGNLYYPKSDDNVPERMSELKVQVMSATPSYWKKLINSWPTHLMPLSLDQATLGGEKVNQDIIDLIRKFFNPKKISHIYASSEGGTSIVVSDELEGFPASYLNQAKEIQLRVKEGSLQIKTPFGMEGYLNKKPNMTSDGWIETGDLVEIKGSRVYFLGRDDDVINVGGMKVHPAEVEKILEQLDDVEAATVYGKKNPITGSMVAAHIVMKEGKVLNSAVIIQKLKPYLVDYKIPRLLKQVHQLEVSPNGKKIRPQ